VLSNEKMMYASSLMRSAIAPEKENPVKDGAGVSRYEQIITKSRLI
jgi:hypothetical protein